MRAFQPSQAQRRVAELMSELRTKAGYSQRDIVMRTQLNTAAISRLENGLAKFEDATLLLLAELYDVPSEDTERLLAMARDDRTPGWWQRYEQLLSASLVALISAEDEATEIFTVQTMFVPALLQTRSYTQALVAAGRLRSPDQAEALVEVRRRRVQRLKDPGLQRYSALLGESVLYWRYGSDETQHQQLEALCMAAELPHVSIRILPFSHAVSAYPLELFGFGSDDTDAVVFSEDRWGTPRHQDPLEVRQARREILELESRALPADESLALIQEQTKRSI